MLGGNIHILFLYFPPFFGGEDINGVGNGIEGGPGNGLGLEFDIFHGEIGIDGDVPEPGSDIDIHFTKIHAPGEG